MFKIFSYAAILLTVVSCATTSMSQVSGETTFKCLAPKPIVIGHRGASGYRPEHTLASYELAIEQGADFIEPDLVVTKDGILIARHENEISGTTDVADKFPKRKTKKNIDGKDIEGWFTEDFTLKEIKTLRAKERLDFRDQSFNGQFPVPTLEEIIELAQKKSKEKGRVIGIYPETKHPTYFKSIGLPFEQRLIGVLKKHGYVEKDSPVFIQSFEISNLKELRSMTKVNLVQLLDDPTKQPYDQVVKGSSLTYGDMATNAGLKDIAGYANGLGPYKRYIVPEGPDKKLLPPTDLVQRAHDVGLLVHPWTFRADKKYLAAEYATPEAEFIQFLKLGVDGYFTDFPDLGVSALNKFWQSANR